MKGERAIVEEKKKKNKKKKNASARIEHPITGDASPSGARIWLVNWSSGQELKRHMQAYRVSILMSR